MQACFVRVCVCVCGNTAYFCVKFCVVSVVHKFDFRHFCNGMPNKWRPAEGRSRRCWDSCFWEDLYVSPPTVLDGVTQSSTRAVQVKDILLRKDTDSNWWQLHFILDTTTQNRINFLLSLIHSRTQTQLTATHTELHISDFAKLLSYETVIWRGDEQLCLCMIQTHVCHIQVGAYVVI